MAKVTRNFRIDSELLKAMEDLPKDGITTSQLIELACYNLMQSKKSDFHKDELETNEKRKNKIFASINASDGVYTELMKIVESKNSTISQEINFILKASLTNESFSNIELSELSKAMIDLNKLGNLLKLSLNNNLNTPELLMDIGLKINDVKTIFNQSIKISSNRKILKNG